MNEKCLACGAQAGAYVCRYCGTTVRADLNEEEERRALEELHAALVADGVAPAVIKNAFLPRHRDVLIEAGLRMLPILEGSVSQDGSAGRLRAICMKLRLMGNDPVSTQAERQLAEALKAYERYDSNFGRGMLGCFALILAAAIGVGYAAWHALP